MRKSALLVVLGGAWLSAAPVEAAKLTSGTFWLEGNVDRISCGVTYRGTQPTTVLVEIFNFDTLLLDPDSTLDLSPDNPAGSWRARNCPEQGCSAPWCQVTTIAPKAQFRATMCVEAEDDDDDDFTPVACIPVE